MAGFQALRGGWLRKLRLHPKVRCAPLVLPQWRLAFSLSGWCAGNAGFIVLWDSPRHRLLDPSQTRPNCCRQPE